MCVMYNVGQKVAARFATSCGARIDPEGRAAVGSRVFVRWEIVLTNVGCGWIHGLGFLVRGGESVMIKDIIITKEGIITYRKSPQWEAQVQCAGGRPT